MRRGRWWWWYGVALLTNLVDVCLRQIHLPAQVREIDGDLLVEGELRLRLLIACDFALVEAGKQGREHGLDFFRRFCHGEKDMLGLR